MLNANVRKTDKIFLLTDEADRKLFLDINLAEGYILTGKNPVCFADSRYFYAVKDDIKKSGFTPVLFNGIGDIKDYLKDKNISSVYINFDKTTVSEYKTYKTFGVRLLSGTKYLNEIRSVKTEFELDSIEKACLITEKSFYQAIKHLKVGMTEIEFKDILEGLYYKNGASGIAFDTIVAFNENSAIPHHITGSAELKYNSIILVDTGCRVKGYCSDFTRTFFFGDAVNGKFVNCYNEVLKANELAENLITNGSDTVFADKIARDCLKNARLDNYFTHSLGHGLGINIHEYPYLSPKKGGKLKNGQVFTIEPGVYFNGEFGIRIEDTVVLKNGKAQRLFTDDKKLLIIK